MRSAPCHGAWHSTPGTRSHQPWWHQAPVRARHRGARYQAPDRRGVTMSAVHPLHRRRIFTALVVFVGASAAVGALHGQAPSRKRLLFLTHAALYKHASLGPAEAAVAEYG